MFHVQTRIVYDNDRDVPTGQAAELVVGGPNVFAGYWGLPEATAEALRGGGFHTGDPGRIDAEGFHDAEGNERCNRAQSISAA
nr:AMP-binding protein [Mycobacterium attenuatum]